MSREYQRRSKSATAFLYTGGRPEKASPRLAETLPSSSPTFKVARATDDRGVFKPSLTVDITKLVTKERFTETVRELSNMMLEALATYKESNDKRVKRLESQIKQLKDEILALKTSMEEIRAQCKATGSLSSITQRRTSTELIQPDLHTLESGILHLQDVVARIVKSSDEKFSNVKTMCVDNAKRIARVHNEYLSITNNKRNSSGRAQETTDTVYEILKEKAEGAAREIESLREDISQIKRKQIKAGNSIDDLTTNTEHDILKVLNDQELLRAEVRMLSKALVKLQKGEISAQEALAHDFESVKMDVYRRVDDLTMLVQEVVSKLC